MAKEKKNVETLEGQGAEEQKEQSQPEKKYTDEEVNNISVKNSKHFHLFCLHILQLKAYFYHISKCLILCASISAILRRFSVESLIF